MDLVVAAELFAFSVASNRGDRLFSHRSKEKEICAGVSPGKVGC